MSIGFAGVLAIVFIVLKILHKISWSWWLVLAPLWAGAAIAAVMIALFIAGAGTVFALKRRRR